MRSAKRRLAVVDVGDDAEVANAGEVHRDEDGTNGQLDPAHAMWRLAVPPG